MNFEFNMTLEEAIPNEEWEMMEEFTITPELNQQFTDSLDDHHPWFTEDSPYGGPIAEPGLLHQKALEVMTRRYPIETPIKGAGSFHQRQDSELFYPARVGKKVKMEVRLIDKYVKRNRDYVVLEARCTDEDGRLLLISHHCRMIQGKEEKK